ncbi:hypothetical protein AeRB84_019994 [Aphanomyces euteiches]|nr:hypothetical protein AeRB84_019994 [Aphanomyces euteiches]
MWRQISAKNSRQALRRYATNSGPTKGAPAAAKPATPTQADLKSLKPESTPLSKKTPEKRGGGGGVYALLFAAVGTTGGLGYYIHENPQFNPAYLKDNEAFTKFREFVLATFPPTKAGWVSSTDIVLSDPKVQKAEKPKVKDVKEIEQSAKKTLEKKAEEPKKAVVQKTDAEAKKVAEPTKADEKKSEVVGKVTEAAEKVVESAKQVVIVVKDEVAAEKAKVEAVVTKAEAAVKAEVAKAEAAVKAEATKAATAIQKKLDDAAAKEKAAIDELNRELETFEEKAKEASAATKNKVVKKARAEAEALSEELDHTILADIKELDAETLRLRVAQLATEMKNRSKWEAVRMLESLKRMEEEVHGQHAELLRQQDIMHKELLARELRLQEEVLTRTARKELDGLREEHDAQLIALVTTQKAQIQAEFDKNLAALKAESEKKIQEQIAQKAREIQAVAQTEQAGRIKELEAIRVELKAVNEMLGRTSDYEAFSHQVHKVSVAALALTNRIEAAAPLHNEIRALRSAGKCDKFIEETIKTLAPLADGAPSVAQLQQRFKQVQKAARQAALVPENSDGLVGHLFANALYFFMIPPGGPIQGDDAEAIFSRADYALRGGDIESALIEMDKLAGLPREVVSDWVAAAKSRLARPVCRRVYEIARNNTVNKAYMQFYLWEMNPTGVVQAVPQH